MSADKPEFPTSITFTPTASAITFYGGDTLVWLTISPDGVIAVGPGLSDDEATQRVANMLAERYSQLHRDQASALASTQAEILRLKAALEPFGELGSDEGNDDFPDDTPAVVKLGRVADFSLTLGDFRRAARSLSQDGEEGA